MSEGFAQATISLYHPSIVSRILHAIDESGILVIQVLLLGLLWYMVLTVLGLLVLPLSMRLFRLSPEGGILLARPLGWILLGFVSWSASYWLGAPFTALGLCFTAAVLLALSAYILRSRTAWLLRRLRVRWRTALNGEILAIAAFTLFLFIRAFDPHVDSTEKPMDLMMLSSLIHAREIPPQDLWYAGETINYHYGGYLLHAIPAKLIGLHPEYAYNLAIATTISFAVAIAFVLGRALFGRCRWGALTAATTLFAGNMAAALNAWSRNALPSDLYQLKYLYLWNTSRVIQDPGEPHSTINEYPFFTLMWGDLHPHFSNIPLVLFFMAIIYALTQAAMRLSPQRFISQDWPLLLVAIVVNGLLLPVNVFDFPILSGLFCGTLALAFIYSMARNGVSPPRIAIVVAVLLTPLMAYLAASPFWLNFINPLRGDLLGWAPNRTGLFSFLLVFGAHTLASCFFAAAWVSPRLLRANTEVASFIAALAGIALVALWALTGHVAPTLATGFTFFFAGLALWTALARDRQGIPVTRFCGYLYCLAICALGWALIAGCEFIYLPDDYAAKRMNTLFKFHFAAWILLGVGLPPLLYWSIRRLTNAGQRIAATLPLFLLLAASLYGPAYTLTSLAWMPKPRPLTLDGLAFLDQNAPPLRDMIGWLRENAPPNARLLEIPGDGYRSTDSLVSTATGLPGLVGWVGHQALWRRNIDAGNPYQRRDEAMYAVTTPNWDEARTLLAAYEVDYVVIHPPLGEWASSRMPQARQGALRRELQPVFQAPGQQLFEIYDVRNIREAKNLE